MFNNKRIKELERKVRVLTIMLAKYRVNQIVEFEKESHRISYVGASVTTHKDVYQSEIIGIHLGHAGIVYEGANGFNIEESEITKLCKCKKGKAGK